MVGVSTACLYPLETEKSLELLVKNGVKGVEIFINAESEIEEGFLSYLRDLCLGYGVRIISLHPHTTFAESFYFFNKYERRQNDSFELYRRLFAKTAYLGAEVFNFHGANSYYNVEPDEYAETLGKLFEIASSEGVVLSQENVSRCKCGDPSYIKAVADILGDNCAFTLDVKQAHRAGAEPTEFARMLGSRIKLVHINDFNAENDCLLPTFGEYDLGSFKDVMNAVGFGGNYIIEVYRHSFDDVSEIFESKEKLENIILRKAGK